MFTKNVIALSLIASAAMSGQNLGEQIALQTSNGFYLTAENGGGMVAPRAVVTNRRLAAEWETFTIGRSSCGYTFKTASGTFLTAEAEGRGGLSADRRALGPWECFKLVWVDRDRMQVALKTVAGTYVTAENNGGKPAAGAISTDRTQIGPWETFTLVDRSEKPNGRNVKRVVFDSGKGQFRQAGQGTWVEESADGDVRFRFREMNRDDWSVYLFDPSRNVNLQLDLHTKKINYSDASHSSYQIYAVTAAYVRAR
jgi:hypothetical protein